MPATPLNPINPEDRNIYRPVTSGIRPKPVESTLYQYLSRNAKKTTKKIFRSPTAEETMEAASEFLESPVTVDPDFARPQGEIYTSDLTRDFIEKKGRFKGLNPFSSARSTEAELLKGAFGSSRANLARYLRDPYSIQIEVDIPIKGSPGLFNKVWEYTKGPIRGNPKFRLTDPSGEVVNVESSSWKKAKSRQAQARVASLLRRIEKVSPEGLSIVRKGALESSIKRFMDKAHVIEYGFPKIKLEDPAEIEKVSELEYFRKANTAQEKEANKFFYELRRNQRKSDIRADRSKELNSFIGEVFKDPTHTGMGFRKSDIDEMWFDQKKTTLPHAVLNEIYRRREQLLIKTEKIGSSIFGKHVDFDPTALINTYEYMGIKNLSRIGFFRDKLGSQLQYEVGDGPPQEVGEKLVSEIERKLPGFTHPKSHILERQGISWKDILELPQSEQRVIQDRMHQILMQIKAISFQEGSILGEVRGSGVKHSKTFLDTMTSYESELRDLRGIGTSSSRANVPKLYAKFFADSHQYLAERGGFALSDSTLTLIPSGGAKLPANSPKIKEYMRQFGGRVETYTNKKTGESKLTLALGIHTSSVKALLDLYEPNVRKRLIEDIRAKRMDVKFRYSSAKTYYRLDDGKRIGPNVLTAFRGGMYAAAQRLVPGSKVVPGSIQFPTTQEALLRSLVVLNKKKSTTSHLDMGTYNKHQRLLAGFKETKELFAFFPNMEAAEAFSQRAQFSFAGAGARDETFKSSERTIHAFSNRAKSIINNVFTIRSNDPKFTSKQQQLKVLMENLRVDIGKESVFKDQALSLLKEMGKSTELSKPEAEFITAALYAVDDPSADPMTSVDEELLESKRGRKGKSKGAISLSEVTDEEGDILIADRFTKDPVELAILEDERAQADRRARKADKASRRAAKATARREKREASFKARSGKLPAYEDIKIYSLRVKREQRLIEEAAKAEKLVEWEKNKILNRITREKRSGIHLLQNGVAIDLMEQMVAPGEDKYYEGVMKNTFTAFEEGATLGFKLQGEKFPVVSPTGREQVLGYTAASSQIPHTLATDFAGVSEESIDAEVAMIRGEKPPKIKRVRAKRVKQPSRQTVIYARQKRLTYLGHSPEDISKMSVSEMIRNVEQNITGSGFRSLHGLTDRGTLPGPGVPTPSTIPSTPTVTPNPGPVAPGPGISQNQSKKSVGDLNAAIKKRAAQTKTQRAISYNQLFGGKARLLRKPVSPRKSKPKQPPPKMASPKGISKIVQEGAGFFNKLWGKGEELSWGKIAIAGAATLGIASAIRSFLPSDQLSSSAPPHIPSGAPLPPSRGYFMPPPPKPMMIQAPRPTLEHPSNRSIQDRVVLTPRQGPIDVASYIGNTGLGNMNVTQSDFSSGFQNFELAEYQKQIMDNRIWNA